MPSTPSLTITHIGTATAILTLNGVNFLTDPVFSQPGTHFTLTLDSNTNTSVTLETTSPAPSLTPQHLPPIEAILLSHHDHPDNLDSTGRQLLNARHVLTTPAASSALGSRPGIRGLQPWETISLALGGIMFRITATPCLHLPGAECTGFILSSAEMGVSPDGRVNGVYVSGDTVFLDNVARRVKERWHVVAAVLNLGAATVPVPGEAQGTKMHMQKMQITMDGAQGASMFREIGADVLVPMHYESWEHFAQKGRAELERVFEREGVLEKVCWLIPGQATRVL